MADDAPHTLTLKLSGAEMDALWRIFREEFPNTSLEATAQALLRDELVRLGVLPLPEANRSRGAQQTKTPPV